MNTGARLDRARVRALLPAFFDPAEVVALLPSTMSRAAELADAGAAEGTLVLADHQTAGRGRLDRAWTERPGTGLLLSVVLRPSLPPDRAWCVLAVAAVALADAAGQVLGGDGDVALKWPNDLLVGGRKAAGLLAEARPSARPGPAVVLGMGVNVTQRPEDFPPDLRDRVTSLSLAAGKPVDRGDLLAAWGGAFAGRYRTLGPDGAGILPEYRARLATLGQRVRVTRVGDEPVVGRAVDVRGDGALVVETAAGEGVVVGAGDVEHLRAVG